MTRKLIRRWAGAAGICLAVSACGHEDWFHTYRQIPAAVWAKADTLAFELPAVPDSGFYDFSVEMRTTADFPYTGLKIAALTVVGEAVPERRDTVDAPVQSATGAPLGEGLTLRHHESPLFRLFLPAGERPVLRLFHLMRREDIPGITAVGLKVSPVRPR